MALFEEMNELKDGFFSLSFDGESEMEASLLGIALSNTAYLINETANNEPGISSCKLKVKTFLHGSFIIDLALTIVVASQMSVLPDLTCAAAVVNVFKGMLDIKKHLKGDPPKAINESEDDGYVHVECADGTSVTAPLAAKIVISKPVIDKKLSEMTAAIHLHNPNGGFALVSGGETAYYNSSDVQDMSVPMPSSNFEPDDRYSENRVMLPIGKVDFVGQASWSFRYGRRSISAKIEDAKFLRSIHDGVVGIKAGDMLDVDLAIKTRLDGEGVPIGETYTIGKVYGHVPASQHDQQRF